LASVRGHCWRAVTAGAEAQILDGATRAGRFNRWGERTLYMSGSPAGVAAAMARYDQAARTLVRLRVDAELLIDLRSAEACKMLYMDVSRANGDWLTALGHGEEPASWAVSDRARAIGANGLIDLSRRAPGLWHLVLFRWNAPGAPAVNIG
jgi:RES domain-containing protein